MRTFREFIAEDKMGERLGNMSDTDFDQFLKGRTPEEAKTYKAKRSTFRNSGSAGQGFQDAARQARQGRPVDTSGRAGSPGNSQGGYARRGGATPGSAAGGRTPSGATPGSAAGGRTPSGATPSQSNAFKIPRPTAGQAAVGALNVGLGALEYKGRRDAGQTRTQAGSGAVASAAGGQAGWMTGAKLGAALPILNPLAKGAVTLGLSVAGGMLGSSGASALSDKLSGVTKPSERETLQRQAINQGKGLKGLENARQTSNIRDVRKVSTAYGTKQGSALTGLGGPAKVDTKAGTLTTKGKTVKLASTQLVRDPKTGQQRVGDLAYKGGKAVYLARPSVASRDTSLSAKVGRALNLGGYSKEAEQQAAKKEYRTALKNTQSYTKGLGISTKSATAQKLPGYSAAKPKPAVKPSPIFDIKNFNK